jgi:hypothetical protein
MNLRLKCVVRGCCLAVCVAAALFVYWQMQKARLVRAAFRSSVMQVLKDHYPDRDFRLGADPDTIELDDIKFNLVNLYREVGGDYGDEERTGRIVDFFASSLKDISRLRSLNAGWQSWKTAAALNLQLASADFGKNLDLVSQPFVGSLRVFYVLDAGRNVTYVSQDQLRSWGVTVETLHETALRNLDKISRDVELHATPSGDGRGTFLAVDVKDGYAAARLASPAFQKRMALLLGARFYAAVPNRDFLFAWSPDYAHHDGFVKQAAADFRQPYPISPAIFRVTPGNEELAPGRGDR